MGPLRISIAGAMGLVALVAVEVAALRSAEAGWVDACRLLTASVLVLAAFLARGRRGGEGAFWFGFAVFGWAAFVLVVDALAGMEASQSAISRLPLLVVGAIADRAEMDGYGAHLRTLRQLRILHFMLIPPAGLVGGVVVWWADRRRRRRRAARPPDLATRPMPLVRTRIAVFGLAEAEARDHLADLLGAFREQA